MKVIGFVLFAIGTLAIAALGCALLLPIYSHVESSLLLQEGKAASANGENDSAMAELTQAIALNPKDPTAYEVRADVDVAKGNYAQIIADYKQAMLFDPKNAVVVNNYAWTLATCPDASLRDGKKAVEFATRACELSNWQYAASIDTLAAAYAEAGDFDSAVKWENKYLTSLSLSPSDAADGQARLALFQAHQPYHESK